jgi:hypothetical protein
VMPAELLRGADLGCEGGTRFVGKAGIVAIH